jgi:hypothetical protein
MRFLLKQVIAQLPSVPAGVSAKYSRFKTDPHHIMPGKDSYGSLLRFSLEEIRRLRSSPSFVLLDAYDEFRNDKEDDFERAVLLSRLSEMSRVGLVKILITTRPHYQNQLECAFPDFQVAEFRGDVRDVELYLELKLKVSEYKPEVKDEIRRTLLEKNKNEPW